MMESFGNWNFSYTYIDEEQNPNNEKPWKRLRRCWIRARQRRRKPRYVPITRKIEGKDHEITFGQYGTFRGHLVEGGLGGSPKIVNPPGADPIHHQYAQGRTSKMTNTDADQNWAWTTRTICSGLSPLIMSNTKNTPPVLPRRWLK